MEKLKFVLELVDKVTKPARRVAKSLSGITKVMAVLGRVTKRASALFGRFSRVARRVGRISAVLMFLSRAKNSMDGIASSGAAQALKSLSSRFADLVISASKFAAIMGAIGTTLLTRSVVKMTAFAERSRLALRNLSGGAFEGERAFQTAISLAEEYGLEVDKTVASFTKLRAAQFTLGETKELIKLTTDLRAIGATSLEVASAIRAITQIKAKGRLQAEELVGQLAEAGVATTLVYEALSKQLGKTQDEVRKLITAGKISADVGISAITQAVLKKANIQQAGDAGRQFADATLTGLFNRLKAAPGFFVFRVSELLKGDADIEGIVRDINRALDTISVTGVAKFVKEILRLVRDTIPLIQEFATGFGEGFREVLGALRGTEISAAGNREVFRTLGKVVAQAFGIAIRLGSFFAKTLAFLGNKIGGTGASIILLVSWMSRMSLVAGGLKILVLSLSAVFISLKIAVFAVGAVFKAVVITIELLALVLKPVIAGLSAMLSSALAIPAALAAIGVGLATLSFINREALAKEFLKFFDQMVQFFTDLGAKVVDGFAAGFLSLLPKLVSLGIKVKQIFSDALGISSPSRVMMKLGEQSAAGFNIGMDRAMGSGPVVSRVDNRQRSGVDMMRQAGKRGGNSQPTRMNTEFNITVQGNVDAGNAKSVGRDIGRSAAEEFTAMLDQAAASQGA